MRITGIEVDAFGAWNDLAIGDLSKQLTVFYGANEAGKTTLLQLVRAVLYGFSPERQRRYLPPRAGGRPGGSLRLGHARGRFVVSRHTGGADVENGTLVVTAADGTTQPAAALGELLWDVDETTFNNVFAVGLRELQELGTLSDTDAAHWLYSLASGLDRVSLVDVIRELRTSRTRLLSPDGRPSVVTQLLGRRARLAEEIEELADGTERWAGLRARQQQLERQLATIDSESALLTRTVRELEAAIGVREKWGERSVVETRLAGLADGDLPDVPLSELEEISERIERYRSRRETAHAEADAIREEARELRGADALRRAAPRIAALGEQREWIASLDQQIGDLDGEIAQLESRVGPVAETAAAGLAASGLAAATSRHSLAGGPEVGPQLLEALRPAARALRETKQRWQTALRAEPEALLRSRQESAAQLNASDDLQRDVAQQMEETEQRAVILRRRIQLDKRRTQLTDYRRELEEDSLEYLDRELMPMWVLAGLGASFVLGMTSLMATLWMPSAGLAGLGWTLSLVGVGGSVVMKLIYQHVAENNTESCREQLELVTRQLAEVEAEEKQVDAELPSGGGPLAVRLRTAEQELAELQALLPGSEEPTGEVVGDASLSSVDAARGDYESARHVWSEALTRFGLPSGLSPRGLRDLSTRHARQGETSTLLARLHTQRDARRREAESIAVRVDELYRAAELSETEGTTLARVDALLAAASRQQGLTDRRETLRRRYRKLREEERQSAASLAKYERRRRELLRAADVSSEAEYRVLATRLTQRSELEARRAQLTGEIVELLGPRATPEQVAPHLADDPETLESQWEEASSRLERGTGRVGRLREQLGELAAQQQTLADDRRLAEKQQELAAVEARLGEALRQWQVRAAAGSLLDSIRVDYEQHRQPETLVEASEYLAQLTGGRYVRIWTPIGEESLRVDDRQGDCWSVDVLSRGTREQLFLSLRLALVSLYARKGIQLPLVLDDVLVNFDARRAERAARVVVDFAHRGHQVLLFTCHKHVWKTFKTLGADVRALPERSAQPPVSHPPAGGLREYRVDAPQQPEPVAAQEGKKKAKASHKNGRSRAKRSEKSAVAAGNGRRRHKQKSRRRSSSKGSKRQGEFGLTGWDQTDAA